MVVNRIQKLLLSEYCDFEDTVLVESTFAETDRNGNGIRQINLGLTPTKLIMAADILKENKMKNCKVFCDLDPITVDFELIAVIPLEYIHLSLYHRRKKYTIKIKFCTNKVWYFELGGTENRKFMWKTWCHRIQLLNKNEEKSESETSAGTTSTSTIISSITNIISDTKFSSNRLKKPQVWCKFNKASDRSDLKGCKNWTDKYIFLGSSLEDRPLDYTPVIYFPSKCRLLCQNKKCNKSFKRSSLSKICNCENTQKCTSNRKCNKVNRFASGVQDNCETALIFRKPTKINSSILTTEKFIRINRFGNGIDEKCIPGLHLPTESYMKMKKIEQMNKKDHKLSQEQPDAQSMKIIHLQEDAVTLWENKQIVKTSAKKSKHERKYALLPDPNFFQTFGLGRLSIQKRQNIKKIKQTVSELSLMKDKELISQSFSRENFISHMELILPSRSRNVCPFWLHTGRYFSSVSRIFYRQRQALVPCIDKKENQSSNANTMEPIILFRQASKNWEENISSEESQLSSRKASMKDLARILRVELKITAWDFDHGSLASQLTLIDKNLFLNISQDEIISLLTQNANSTYYVNLKIWMVFSYRITCLVATEILKKDTSKTRARIMARFINTANACLKMANFQSCGSILSGLQIPAIYRLKNTWYYLRERHSTQYRIFYYLSRLFSNVSSNNFSREFEKVERTRPYYLPRDGFLISVILKEICKEEPSSTDLMTYYCIPTTEKTSEKYFSYTSKTFSSTSLIKNIVSSIKLPTRSTNKMTAHTGQANEENFEKIAKSNFDEKKKFQKYLILFNKYKSAAENYTIKKHKLVQDYLLHSKYEDEVQLFKKSLHIEP